MRARNLLFGTETNTTATDVGLLLLRLFSGLALAFAHGMGKVPPAEGFVGRVSGMGVPAPALFAWLAAIAEFAGGLLIAAGLLTRPASLLVAGHFLFVVFIAHAGDPFRARELGLFFFFAAVLFLLAGAGRYSIDAVLGRRAR